MCPPAFDLRSSKFNRDANSSLSKLSARVNGPSGTVRWGALVSRTVYLIVFVGCGCGRGRRTIKFMVWTMTSQSMSNPVAIIRAF